MEFRFDLKPIFPQPIAKINQYLLPHTFRGDRRAALDVSMKVSEIVNKLGDHSAKAQGLTKSVTSADKLRMAENQRLYLLVDTESGPRGAVIGLLKVGVKSLYVFDEFGATQHLDAPCILDFYIHDTRQRSGLGRDLFETMLAEEQWVPNKLAIDRPSDKLVGFMRKHYGLTNAIPQTNNFVIYEGFFDRVQENNNQNGNQHGLHITDSPNTALFGPHFVGGDNKRRLRHESPSPLSQVAQNSPVGRYAAARPSCSMAEIIHSNSKPATGERNRSRRDTIGDYIQSEHDVCSVQGDLANLNLAAEPEKEPEPEPEPESEPEPEPEPEEAVDGEAESHVERELSPEINKRPSNFRPHNKQHTGLKNISFGVGLAVTPSSKMEFDQEQTEEFGVLKINRPPGKLLSPQPDMSDAVSTVSSGEGFTDQGYYDLKFHHNKLW